MKKFIVSDITRLSVYALTLIGATAGSVIGAFEILPEGRALRIALLVIACFCVACNIWLKWQDAIEAEKKAKTIEDLRGELDAQSKMMKTLMANSVPSAQTLRTVQERFAKLLTLRGWKEFVVVDFESPEETIKAFVSKAGDGKIERLMWLHADEINLLSAVCGGDDFERVASDLLDKDVLPGGVTVDEVWNQIPDAIMPVMLFAYDVRGLRLDAAGKRMCFPVPAIDVETVANDLNVEVADYQGKQCAWAVFDHLFLASLFGHSRIDVSQIVIDEIRKLEVRH